MSQTQFAAVIFVAFALAVVYCETVTPSEQCSGENFEDLRGRVQVIPCGANKCRLQKGTNVTVIFKFKPEFKVKSLTNKVYAMVAGVPLPFVGVDGVSACPQVTRVADGTPATCPLAPHEEYTYTNVFFIESFYPAISLRVHWSLNDGKRDVICFEVPAVITAAKKNKAHHN